MAQRFPPATELQKYFPDLAAPTGGELSSIDSVETNDLFGGPFAVSRFASAILPRAGRDQRCGAWESCNVEEKTKRHARRHGFVRGSGVPAFASITEPAAPEGCSTSGGSGEGAEVEGVEERKWEGGSKRKTKSSWDDMPKFLLAGAVSTIISRTCVAPLERIKLQCIIQGPGQSLPEIVRCIWMAEGARGFWKGNLLNLFRMIPFKCISFVCYDMYCDCILHAPGKSEINNHDRLVGGGISGVAATVVCLPLDTIRTRLIAPGGEALGGVEGCFFHMVRNEGFLSLYKGLAPALISMGPSSAVFYAVYDILKAFDLSQRRRQKGGAAARKDLGILRTLVYGAVAGACAETVTYPLEVLRRQLQLQQSSRLGMASALVMLVRRDGAGSLFAGLLPSTLQVLPSAALSYLFYELMKSQLKIS